MASDAIDLTQDTEEDEPVEEPVEEHEESHEESQPKEGTQPQPKLMPLADAEMTQLRFKVGDRVRANCGEWKEGTVVKLFYTQKSFPAGTCAPYQIRLDDPDKLIFAPADKDSVVQALVEAEEGEGEGMPRKKDRKQRQQTEGVEDKERRTERRTRSKTSSASASTASVGASYGY